MPLYEYLCAKCGNRFEKIEKLGAPEKQKCPKCGAKAERAISASAIQFKGSGWYVTDYAKKSGMSSPESSGDSGGSRSGEKTGDGAAAKSDTGSSESKPPETKSASSSEKPAASKKKK